MYRLGNAFKQLNEDEKAVATYENAMKLCKDDIEVQPFKIALQKIKKEKIQLQKSMSRIMKHYSLQDPQAQLNQNAKS